MADAKITELTAYTTPISTDVLPIVDVTNSITKKATMATMKAFGMLNSKIITATRNMTAAGGNVSYTGVGFQPTSIIVFYYITDTKTSGWGMVDSSKNTGQFRMVGDTGNYRGNNDSAGGGGFFIFASTGAADVDQYAGLSSFDSDGFTLTWSKRGSPTGTLNLYFLCFR